MPALVEVTDLRTYFHTDDGTVRAVDDVSFTIEEGKTLGIVGESGSGKSVTSLSIMQLLATAARIETGHISFLGKDLVKISEPEMRKIRGAQISMIFQEPMTSLNPVFTVGDQVAEAIILHQQVGKAEARKKTIELFREVGIPDPEERIDSYPHQMSGGQKQRVMIAMALSCNPKLLIADEPTTALDVTIQAQILDILRRLRDNRGMAILFITHDLGVIAEIADEVAVMFAGKIVEYGKVIDIYANPQHPYTKGLLACRPKLESPYKRLPTVTDFMESREIDGKVEVIAKQLDDARIQQLCTQGRDRLLHPREELQAMGHPASEVDRCVPDGTQPLLAVRDLQVHFPVRKGFLQRVANHVKAVDGISFNVYPGQTLGLVGESGCGKTTTGRAVLRLIEPTDGEIQYNGSSLEKRAPASVCPDCNRRIYGESVKSHWREVIQCHRCILRDWTFSTSEWAYRYASQELTLRDMRKHMQIIFQDPYGSLNPRMTVESALVEPMWIQKIGKSTADRRERAVSLLEEVGLSAMHLRRYPHEFSGGQRQRICIARALSVEPEFIICDESVSALDVSVQAQVLNLLKNLQEKMNLTYIFISHDLSVVKFMADMMAVMRDGIFVEFGPSEAIYADPQRDYTRKLIEATPQDTLENIRRRQEEREAALAQRLG